MYQVGRMHDPSLHPNQPSLEVAIENAIRWSKHEGAYVVWEMDDAGIGTAVAVAVDGRLFTPQEGD